MRFFYFIFWSICWKWETNHQLKKKDGGCGLVLFANTRGNPIKCNAITNYLLLCYTFLLRRGRIGIKCSAIYGQAPCRYHFTVNRIFSLFIIFIYDLFTLANFLLLFVILLLKRCCCTFLKNKRLCHCLSHCEVDDDDDSNVIKTPQNTPQNYAFITSSLIRLI